MYKKFSAVPNASKINIIFSFIENDRQRKADGRRNSNRPFNLTRIRSICDRWKEKIRPDFDETRIGEFRYYFSVFRGLVAGGISNEFPAAIGSNVEPAVPAAFGEDSEGKLHCSDPFFLRL